MADNKQNQDQITQEEEGKKGGQTAGETQSSDFDSDMGLEEDYTE